MYETKTDALELIRDLAQALRAHHLGHTTTEPFARTYRRDRELVNRAGEFLMAAESKPLPQGCEFCNVAPGAHEVKVEGEPGLMSLACGNCLQEIQLGHVLKDIYGWSWILFGGKYIAECVESEPEPEEVADVPS